ncbi:MAG: hypothetical protein LBM97_02210 [Candidatus Nomurabacteria bacterium]|jgi:phosphatidylglycerophosphate synthase|nr:hypothetical protein [Candidatus Nomurabacteria bacterium]
MADGLTAFRAVVGIVIAAGMIYHPVAVTVLFALAVLSDALDGTFAKKFPYSDEENATLIWRRIDPHTTDNIADSIAFFGGHIWIAMWIFNGFWLRATIIVVPWLISIGFLVAIAVVKKHNKKVAEMVDVVFGWFYGSAMAVMLIVLLANATTWWLYIVAPVAPICVFLLIKYKWDRLTTRPDGYSK